MTDEELFEKMVELAAEFERRERERRYESEGTMGDGIMATLYEQGSEALFDVANQGRHYGGIEGFVVSEWGPRKKMARKNAEYEAAHG
jgi:hypothetical protein